LPSLRQRKLARCAARHLRLSREIDEPWRKSVITILAPGWAFREGGGTSGTLGTDAREIKPLDTQSLKGVLTGPDQTAGVSFRSGPDPALVMTPGPRSKTALAAGPAVEPARLDGTNINLTTLLATDFLNHFNEAIMLLEMLPMAPECKDDFLAWRPMSYTEHFAASNFKHRDLAIAAYEVADLAYRRPLDQISRQMHLILIEARNGLKGDLSDDTIRALAEATVQWLKPMVARAGAVINGELEEYARPAAEAAPQDAIDALFEDAVKAVCHA